MWSLVGIGSIRFHRTLFAGFEIHPLDATGMPTEDVDEYLFIVSLPVIIIVIIFEKDAFVIPRR